MPLTYITGPMKSGKSRELIARLSPYEYSNEETVYVQPKKNTRSEGVIFSRSGLQVAAQMVMSLAEVDCDFDVIGVDEFNFFKPEDAEVIGSWLLQDKQVFVAGLDLDMNGRLWESTKSIYQLKPNEIIDLKAACAVCQDGVNAQFTQGLVDGDVVHTTENENYHPDDGKTSIEYQPRCRDCFVPPVDVAHLFKRVS